MELVKFIDAHGGKLGAFRGYKGGAADGAAGSDQRASVTDRALTYRR